MTERNLSDISGNSETLIVSAFSANFPDSRVGPTFRMYESCMHHVWCSFILLKSKNSTMSDVSDVKKVDTTKIPFQVSSQVGLQHFSFSCQNPPPVLPLPCYHPAHWHQCHHSFHNHHPSQNYLFNHVSSIFHVLLVVE